MEKAKRVGEKSRQELILDLVHAEKEIADYQKAGEILAAQYFHLLKLLAASKRNEENLKEEYEELFNSEYGTE